MDTGSEPLTLACPTVSSCVGVGSYNGPVGHSQGLLVIKLGREWAALRAPLPANTGHIADAMLTAVACGSASRCVAVGSYTDSAGRSEGMLLTGAGRSWTALEVTATLTAVACASAAMCVATGSYRTLSGTEGVLITGAGPPGLPPKRRCRRTPAPLQRPTSAPSPVRHGSRALPSAATANPPAARRPAGDRLREVVDRDRSAWHRLPRSGRVQPGHLRRRRRKQH